MDLNFNKNEDHNKLLIAALRQKLVKVKLGGGKNRIEKHHAKGKMTARERIEYLLDPKTKNIEIAAFKKIKHFGIDQYCSWGGFGDQHRDRSDMARAAIKLAGQRKEINSIENVYVIGDTPNDIRCGKAINAITIAVATASYSVEQLSDYDPDWLFPDLSDLDMILSLLN